MKQRRNETTKQGTQKLLEAGVAQKSDSPSKSTQHVCLVSDSVPSSCVCGVYLPCVMPCLHQLVSSYLPLPYSAFKWSSSYPAM